MSKLLKVLIVDDSALMRELLSAILENDPSIEVVGTAPHPLKAREMIKKYNPDVLTLDIDMPKMNGIEFLEKIMRLRPMPVVMISSLTQAGASVTLKALEIGAVDFIAKPQIDLERGIRELSHEILRKVKMAAIAQVRPHVNNYASVNKVLVDPERVHTSHKKLVAIGASTGGVEALRTILSALPRSMPPIFIVQHMPKQFTSSFASRLDGLCELQVLEAEHGQVALSGHVYIAPGDMHLKVISKPEGQWVCHLEDSDPVQGHKPSVNVLFDSLANPMAKDMIGLILTGMGRDGASGLKSMRECGAVTMGQSKSSCVVYGMPKAAFDIGAVEREIDLQLIAEELVRICHEGEPVNHAIVEGGEYLG